MKREKHSIDEPLKKAVRGFLRGQPRGTSLSHDALAMIFIDREATVLRQWNIVKITRLIDQEMRAERPPDPYQMFLGFARLTVRLPLREGSTTAGNATVTALRESISVMKAEDRKKALKHPNPKIALAEALVKSMSPMARSHHGLTGERYCELRAAGVEVKAKRLSPR